MGTGERKRGVSLNIDGEWDDGKVGMRMRTKRHGGGAREKGRVTFLDQQLEPEDRGGFGLGLEPGIVEEQERDSFLSFDLDGRESLDSDSFVQILEEEASV
jgi:hypothetical protein